MSCCQKCEFRFLYLVALENFFRRQKMVTDFHQSYIKESTFSKKSRENSVEFDEL